MAASSERRARVAQLGRAHAEAEGDGDLAGVLATLVDEPVFEFHPVGRRLRGGARVRRFYDHFFGRFQPTIESYALLGEWVNEDAVVQEYEIALRGASGPERHRVVGILVAAAERLAGERVYASERYLRRMLGEELWAELEPIRDDA